MHDPTLDVPRVVRLPEAGEAWATSASRGTVVAQGAAPGGGEDAWLVLDGERALDLHAPPAPGRVPAARALAYEVVSAAPRAPPPGPFAVPHRADPARLGSGNAFAPLFENARAAGALVGVGAGRRVDAGPESERAFVVLAGTGLVFLQNGDTLALEPGGVALVPAGEPARVWARGPADLAVLALQPQAPPAERRTLASEVRRLKDGRDASTP